MYLLRNNVIKTKKILVILSCLFVAGFNLSVSAQEFNSKNIEEIDSTRAELACFRDKNSAYYLKTKQKLEKLVQKDKLDYSFENRLDDALRLIKLQNYNAAIYELNDLIKNNFETSKCNELLGDISNKTKKPPRKIAAYYKESLRINPNNIAVEYKLAKLYLREKRNILGIEYLRDIIQKTDDKDLLCEIQKIILNNITPQNRYEANNLYEALGWIYLKLNCENEAYSAFERALELNPNDLYLKYYLADLYYLKSKNNDALNIYSMIIDENPTDSQIRLSTAKALENSGNIESSHKQYLEVLTLNPNSASAKFGIYKLFKNLPPDKILQKIYLNKKDYVVNKEECIKFAQLLKNKNDSDGAVRFLEFAKKFNIKEEIKESKQEPIKKAQIKPPIKQETTKPQQQAKPQEQKKETKPQPSPVKKEEVKREEVKQPAKKEPIKETTKKTIEQHPKKEEVKEAAQTTKPQQQTKPQPSPAKKEEVKQPAKQAPKEEPKKEEPKKEPVKEIVKKQTPKEEVKKEVKETVQKAKPQQKAPAKKEEKITKEIRKPLKIDKTSKKYLEFKKIAEKYQAIEPKDKLTYIAIANTYKLMGELYLAIDNFNQALRLEPTDSDIQYNLGLTYMELDSFETAKSHLEKAVNLNPENQKAINLLAFVNQKLITQIINEAYTKYENEQYIPAFQTLENGIKKYPNTAQLYYYRALVFSKMNRNAAQIIDLQKAIELDPSYYMSYYQLGLAYEKVKDERSALVAYERFLSTEPDEKELVKEVEKKVLELGKKYY